MTPQTASNANLAAAPGNKLGAYLSPGMSPIALFQIVSGSSVSDRINMQFLGM
jgi:hypothetical protein